MSLSWEKLGKFLVGLIAALAAIATIYAALVARPASLTAKLTYDYQNYPTQYIERLSEVNAKFQYSALYEQIRVLSGGSLDHEKIDAIVTYAMNTYFSTYKGLFEKGPKQYGTSLFIYIDNNSNKAAKNIVINLPELALVLIEDEAGASTAPNTLLRTVNLSSIAPSNHAKIWAYFSADLEALKKEPIRISHTDGVADVSVSEAFNGIDAEVARNSTLVLFVCGVLFVLATACFSLLVLSSNNRQP